MPPHVPHLRYTGERMVPEATDHGTYWEHIYRYRFAWPYVRGKRVLDVACGEGYGTASLRDAGAASVLGLDISMEACIHARRKYGVDARVADALDLPLADGSVDVVVSFETIEHLEDPPRFAAECRRVLAPGGQLLVSTPNRPIFSPTGHFNHFHCCEMDREEFLGVLTPHFREVRLFSQRPFQAPWWSPRSLVAYRSVGRSLLRATRLRPLLRSLVRSDVRSNGVAGVVKQQRAGDGAAERGAVASPQLSEQLVNRLQLAAAAAGSASRAAVTPDKPEAAVIQDAPPRAVSAPQAPGRAVVAPGWELRVADLLNPYLVRPFDPRESPVYFVAVCTA